MPDLHILDGNVTVGSRGTSRTENGLDPGQLVAEMDHAGIAACLAYHAHAREYDPRIGNARLSDLAAREPRFLPCYVLLPEHTGEMPAGDALLRYLADGGARAARLFPRDHQYGLGETWCGQLLATLAEAGVPLLLDADQTSLPEVDEVLTRHPRLRLLLLRFGYRTDRWLYPMLTRHAGLHLELSLYPLHGGVEAVSERFGPGRLVFGSGLPLFDPAAPLAQLQYAALDLESRRRIAAGNLVSLLWQDGPQPSAVSAVPADRLWRRVRSGGVLDDVAIIDAHAHMGPWYNFAIAGNPWAEGMVAAMDACGIDAAVIAPHVGIGPDMAEGNALAAEAAARFPGRIFAYCTVNPNAPAAHVADQLDRWLGHPAFRGIKLHPVTHDYPADGEGYRQAWAAAEARGLPVLIHTWQGDERCKPALFERLAAECPRARLILGHSGGTAAGIDEAIGVASRVPNVYLDITRSLVHFGSLEKAVRAVGADRILFGTDLPFIGCAGPVGHVAAARLDPADKEKIFGLNARQLFGIRS